VSALRVGLAAAAGAFLGDVVAGRAGALAGAAAAGYLAAGGRPRQLGAEARELFSDAARLATRASRRARERVQASSQDVIDVSTVEVKATP
jgi:hypothetical protein